VNARGGLSTDEAIDYLGLTDLRLTLDTAKLGLWRGGTLTVDFQNLAGKGQGLTNRYLGGLQRISSIEAPQFTQVSWYFYEQKLFAGKLRIKLGKMDANKDFAYVKNGLDFVNSSAGYPPNIPLPAYPDDALGIVARFEPTDEFYAAAGVYDARGSGRQWGFSTALHSPQDSFSIAEIGVKPTWRIGDSRLPGRYAVGGWYDSRSFSVFPASAPAPPNTQPSGTQPAQGPMHRGNSGVYVMIDQQLYNENPGVKGDSQGLGMFLQYSWAPYEYNLIESQYGAGLVYTGLIPTRDQDVAGLMMSLVSLSPRVQKVQHRYSETVIEWFYGWHLTPAAVIKPDLQYVVTPGGAGRDAVVFTLRFDLSF